MPVLTDQLIAQGGDRTYHVHVPANPAQATVPAIVVFHGGGQDAATIARRWGLEPGSPVPANVADYLLVFPEADPRLSGEWVHFQKSDSAFPTYDLEFVDLLLQELTTRLYADGFGGGARRVRRSRLDLCRRVLQRCRDGVAVDQLGPGRPVPWLRRRRQGARPGEGPALPPAARRVGRPTRPRSGRLRPRHR